MNFAEKIIDQAWKDGIRFTFSKECQVINCKEISKWQQDIVHQLEGKLTLELCDKHMKDFDKNISFRIGVNKE